MFTTDERIRFNVLRDRSEGGFILSTSEVAEIARLNQAIEDQEAAYLAPATERLRQANIAAATRAEAAERLATMEERFIERLEQTLRELRREREFLLSERQRIFASGVGAA